jgi:hypothetical protein
MRIVKWGLIGCLVAVMALVVSPASAQQCPKGTLRIYTSWPMQGAMIPEGTGMKNGVDMAVAEVGGVVAGYCLEVVNLDDASPQTGKWDGAVEAENANKGGERPQSHRVHRDLQLRGGEGLDADHPAGSHGPDVDRQQLPRAHEEEGRGSR